MTEALVCARCLARSPAGAQFCYACGERFGAMPESAAWAAPLPATMPAWGPPPGYSADGAGAKSLSPAIAVLSIVLVVLGIVLLTVVLDYWRWANWQFNYEEDFTTGGLFYAFAFAFLCAALASFRVAWEMWRMRPAAWRQGIWLACGLLVLEGLSVARWGVEPLDLVGFGVDIGILVFLNRTPVRALFGRPPLGAVAGASERAA